MGTPFAGLPEGLSAGLAAVPYPPLVSLHVIWEWAQSVPTSSPPSAVLSCRFLSSCLSKLTLIQLLSSQ